MNAVFIHDINKEENKYLCNICSTELDNNGIGLKCNPTKHTFCYECILDWYSEIKFKKYTGNYTITCMCPVCRNEGGKLPVVEGYDFVKGIHYIKKVIIKKEKPIVQKCGAKLLSKNDTCKRNGRNDCNGMCMIHFKINQKIEENTIII